MEQTQIFICLGIFVLMLIGFVINKVSMAMVAMLAMVAMVLTGCIDGETALAGFSNTNTILMVSIFIVAEGLNKTQMVKKLSGLIYQVSGGSLTKILVGYVLLTALIAQFVSSNMAVFSIVFPIALTMCENTGISPSKVMFPIGLTAIACVDILPTGGGAVLYSQYNGYLETYGYTDYAFGIMDICKGRLPIMILVILLAIFVVPRFAPEQPVIKTDENNAKKQRENKALSPVREVLGYGIFIVVILGLLFQKQIGIESWKIALAGAILEIVTGVLTDKEAYAAIRPEITLLYIGTLAVGSALTATGAGEVVGGLLAQIVGNTRNSYLIGFLFFIVPFILTQFMMNRSVVNIFTPICIMTCQALQCNPLGPVILVIVGCLTAFMTPMATPAVAMCMAVGGYDVKSVLKMSWLPAILICIVAVGWVMTVFPAF